MSNSIKIDNLSKTVKKYLTNYVEDIEDGVKETTEKLSKEAVKELKKDSPRRKPSKKGPRENPYWKGWSRKKYTKSKRRYIVDIYNKTNYQLTHLLENGHSTKNGGHTKAQPHIKPIEEKYNKLYEKEIKETIIRRSRT